MTSLAFGTYPTPSLPEVTMATPLATADAVDTTTTSATLDTATLTGAPITTRPGRWIDGWNPEDGGQWSSVG